MKKINLKEGEMGTKSLKKYFFVNNAQNLRLKFVKLFKIYF